MNEKENVLHKPREERSSEPNSEDSLSDEIKNQVEN
jgi:hypothetical protein